MMNLEENDGVSKPEDDKKPKNYMCVIYPGLVLNTDKMITHLGGIKKISQARANENKCLELRRTTNPALIPLKSEPTSSNYLLIKIRRKKKKNKDGTVDETFKTSSSAEVMGVVRHTHVFESMADLQFMPKGPCEIIPQQFATADWLDKPSELHINPAFFSRMDTPQDYRYRMTKDEAKFDKEGGLCRTRQKRTHYAIFHPYDHPSVPQEPVREALYQMKCKFIPSECYNKVVEAFNERPAWFKNGLEVYCQIDKEKLKYVLPCIAYYYSTGPWRNLWIKFKYDPRKDQTAWKYQTFDFRLRHGVGSKTDMINIRSYGTLISGKVVNPTRSRASFAKAGSQKTDQKPKKKETPERSERYYIYRDGMLPPYRQMFYQFCDVKLAAFQKLLAVAFEKETPKFCDPKTGWLPREIEGKCRNLMTENLQETLKKIGEDDFSGYPDSDSDQGTNSDATDSEDQPMDSTA